MSTIALIVVLLLFIVGAVGTLLPVLPGTVIACAAVFVHKFWMGEDSVSWGFVAFCAVLAIASLAFDYVLTWWGAKRFGASWKGALGAVVGGLLGMIFLTPIIGLIVGPIAGAILFELMDGRSRREAARAGWGTFVGNLAAFGAKAVCTGVIVIGFFIAV